MGLPTRTGYGLNTLVSQHISDFETIPYDDSGLTGMIIFRKPARNRTEYSAAVIVLTEVGPRLVLGGTL